MRMTAAACAGCFLRLRRCQADAQIELAWRVRALAICPNFLEIGLRFLEQNHSRFAIFPAVIREFNGSFHGFVLRRKYAFQLLGLHHPLVLSPEYDELDECRSSGEYAGRLHSLSPITACPQRRAGT